MRRLAAGNLGEGFDGCIELVGVACGDRDVSSVFDEALAMPRPMPPLPPVTKAVLFERSKGESWREWWDMGWGFC